MEMAGLLSFYSHERPRSLVREIHLQRELQCSNSNGHSQCVHQLMRSHYQHRLLDFPHQRTAYPGNNRFSRYRRDKFGVFSDAETQDLQYHGNTTSNVIYFLGQFRALTV
ncbi:uncharacterized protein LOC144338665 [Macaca mulatta]